MGFLKDMRFWGGVVVGAFVVPMVLRKTAKR